MNPQKPQHLKSIWNKKTILFISLFLIFAIGLGMTTAWLSGYDNPAVYLFEGVQVTCQMVNDYYNAAVQNTGNVNAHIRVAVLVNYRKKLDNDQYGILFPNPPVLGSDYTIGINTTDWVQGADDYYYYKYPVAPDATTAQLITSFNVSGGTPSGYELRVEYLCEGIQSDPNGQAAVNAWGATVDSNNHITGATGITWE